MSFSTGQCPVPTGDWRPASPEERLGIVGVQLQGPVAVRDALRLLLQLGGHRGAVEVELGVGAAVVGVYREGLAGVGTVREVSD